MYIYTRADEPYLVCPPGSEYTDENEHDDHVDGDGHTGGSAHTDGDDVSMISEDANGNMQTNERVRNISYIYAWLRGRSCLRQRSRRGQTCGHHDDHTTWTDMRSTTTCTTTWARTRNSARALAQC